MARSQLTDGMTRIDEQYVCPACGYGGNHSSPTFRQRRCGSCGHRGDAHEFRETPEKPCPECGDDHAPKTHEDGRRSLYTCRSCYTAFTGGGVTV